MAKKRLLAILLATVLVVSAFPIAYLASESTLSASGFTGNSTVELVDKVLDGAEGNTYVRMYDRENYNATFLQCADTSVTLEAGSYYELRFMARTDTVVKDPGNRNFLLARVYIGSTSNAEFDPNNSTLIGSWDGSYIDPGDTWEEYGAVFQIPESGATYDKPVFLFRGSSVVSGYIPLEVDELTLVKVDAETKEPVGDYIIDCRSESSEDWSKYWSIEGSAKKAKLAFVEETEFYRASAPASGNTAISHGKVTLDAGIYELSGDFRLSEIDGSKITVVSNYVTSNTNSANLTIAAGGEASTAAIANEWTTESVEFTLTSKTALMDVEIALDSALSFDFKNIEITKIGDYIPHVGETTHDGWTGYIETVDDVLDTEDGTVGVAMTNEYIHIYNETGEAEAYYGEGSSATTPAMEKGKTYQLSVWMRTSPLDCDDSVTGDERYKDITVNLGTLYYSCISQNKNESYNDSNIKYKRAEFRAVDGVIANSGALRLLPEWNKYTMTFEITDNCTPTKFSDTFPIIFISEGGKEDKIPFDLDDLSLIEVEYDSEQRKYVPVTGNLIDSSKGTNTPYNWRTHSGQGIGVGISVTKLTETEYNRVSVADDAAVTAMSYDATDLEPGVYTVSGKFRLSAINRADFVSNPRVWTTGNLSLDASGVGYMLDNATAEIGVDSWTDVSLDFTVTEKGISELELMLDSDANFDYKDLTIEKTGEYIPPVEKSTYDSWTGYIDIVDDVLDTDNETVGVAETNKYVHVYNKDGESSIIYRETYNASSPEVDLFRGNTYQLSVWLRTSSLDCDNSVDEDLRYKDIEVHLGTKGNTCISQVKSNPNNSSLIEGTNIRKYVYGEFISLEGPKSTTGALRILPEWNKYTMTFEVTETCNELSLDLLMPIIFISNSDKEDKIPFDLDGLSLRQVEYNETTGKYDVVGDEIIDSKMGTNSNEHWYTHGSQNIGVNADVTYLTETEYKRVTAQNDDTATALEYTGTDVFGKGVYTVTAKARLSAINRDDFIANPRIWATDTLTLSSDNSAIVYESGVNTATIGVDSWTDVSYTFTLTEDSSLEGLTLALTDTASLDYKDLKITLVKAIESSWNANGVPCIVVEDVNGDSSANEYVHVWGRISELDLVEYVDEDVNLTAGTTYTMSVYMRDGSIVTDRTNDFTPIQVYYSAPTTDRLVTSDTVTDDLIGDFDGRLDAALVTSGWKEYKMVFTPAYDQTGLRVIFKVLGNADFATTLDIDGLSLTAGSTELITDGTWNTVSFMEDTGVELDILTESKYSRGVNETDDNTEITWGGTAYEAGTYTVTGKFRLASRSVDLIDLALKDYRPDLYISVVTDDNNEATLTAYIGEQSFGAATLTDEWSEVTFTVTSDTAFTDLRLALNADVDIDFDDLKVVSAN